MSQTTLLSHVYAVVFDNGICKVGCSQRNVDSRINKHIASAACFGINVSATFQEVILFGSAHSWESRMIQEASTIAPCIHGNEWFKFESVDNALAFASCHMKQVAQMNVEKVPSLEQPGKWDFEAAEKLRHSFYQVLVHAIEIEGGQSKLAKKLAVSPSTVSSWFARGVPLHIANELVQRYSKRKIDQTPNHTTTKENP